MLKPVLISLAAALTLAPAALAKPMTPETAAAMMRDAGDTDVTINSTTETAFRIDAARDGVYYSVRLFGCDAQKACSGAMMFATFAEPGALNLSVYERNNEYNDSYPYGRGFLLPSNDGGATYTIGLDYAIDISGEAELGNDDIDLFFGILDAYVRHMESTE